MRGCGLLLLCSWAVGCTSLRCVPTARRHLGNLRLPRCSISLSDADIPGDSNLPDDDRIIGGDADAAFNRELNEALERLPEAEKKASSKRKLDYFVDDKKREISAFEEQFERELESTQDALESRIESQLQDLQAETLSKIDAAIADFKNREDTSPAAIEARKAAARAELVPTAELPASALIAVAGGGTAAAQELMRKLLSGTEWRVRVLLASGTELPSDLKAYDTGDDAARVSTATYSPYSPTMLKRSLAGTDALVVVSSGAGGRGGIEPEAMGKLMKAVDGSASRLLMLSVHGVESTGSFPYSLQNLLGQLDNQRAAEQEMILYARRSVPSFSILRVGKLKAGGGAPVCCELSAGDNLKGEIDTSSVAEAMWQSLARPQSVNATFSIAPMQPQPASPAAVAAAWADEFLKLEGPEIYRRRLSSLTPAEAITWLQEWSRRFLLPANKLTTPVAFEDCAEGVLLRFLSTGLEYDDFDEPDDDWITQTPKPSTCGSADGGLLLLAEAEPFARVRVTRYEMQQGASVKEMSEQAVLSALEKDLSLIEARTASRK